MSAPTWLERVLSERAFVDLGTVAGREVMAEAILAAIPKSLLVDTIKRSASIVLRVALPTTGRVMIDDIARELANNATQMAFLALEGV